MCDILNIKVVISSMKRIILISLLLPLLTPAKLDENFTNIWTGTGDCNLSTSKVGCTLTDGYVVGANILKFLFALAIPITVGMFVWGGIQLMTSGASGGDTKKAKETMKNAIIGLVIALAAVLIVNLVKKILTGS